MPLLFGLAILLLDQCGKRAVRGRVPATHGPLVRFRFVAGRAKSFETTRSRVSFLLLWLLALLSALIGVRFGLTFHTPLSLAGLALALGGSASNLLDILRYRCVIDYIDLRWWPVFNLGDAAILGGLAAAFLG